MAILTLQRAIDNVLSLANKPQNASYPPSVGALHFNIALSYVLSDIARLFPSNQSIIELAQPFFEKKIIAVDDTMITLPSDFRHLITCSIAVNENASSKCEANSLESNDINSPLYSDRQQPKEKCRFIPISMLSDDMFNRQTTTGFIKPSYLKPIGKFSDGNRIKICPTDITHVEVRYIRNPKEYRIGYKMMPDDTWQIDVNNPLHIESECTLAMESRLVSAMTTLYSVYSQDRELKVGIDELKKGGVY
jgi:hypothetical protein